MVIMHVCRSKRLVAASVGIALAALVGIAVIKKRKSKKGAFTAFSPSMFVPARWLPRRSQNSHFRLHVDCCARADPHDSAEAKSTPMTSDAKFVKIKVANPVVELDGA